jgi:hypothetical protein
MSLPKFAIDFAVHAAALRRVLLLCALAFVSVQPAGAQLPGPLAPAAMATPGSELTIYHVTMGPGDMVWEKFEHNALWVHDPVLGTDHVYNYGAFDFDEPGYWGRFARGYWRYWLEVSDISRTVFVYREYLNRSIAVQELNLTPAQRADLRDFLEWNALEENRYYYYDYYLDNCSTRIRDAIDRALGGALRTATQDSLTGTTFRWHSERLVADDPAVFTGLLVGLGPGADREINAWEEMFLPGKVQEHLRHLQVPDEAGRMVPLVRTERVLYRAIGREPLLEAPPNRIGWYLLAGLLIGGLFAALGSRVPRSRTARFGFAGTTALWAAFVGTGGLLLAFLWAFTNHAIAYRNENLLQLNPLMLTLVLLIPALAFGARWAARPALWLMFAVAGLSVLGLLLKVLPWFAQANLSLIALALPAHLGLAWATYSLSRAPARSPGIPPAAPPTRAARRRGAPAR